MKVVDEDWRRVGAAITERIRELSLTVAEIDKRGVSDKTVKGYMDGQRIVRADKRRQLCDILGWDPRSIEEILAGRDPIELVRDPSLEERISSLETAVAEILTIVRRSPWGTPPGAAG